MTRITTLLFLMIAAACHAQESASPTTAALPPARPEDICPILAGEPVPGVMLKASDGRSIDLDSLVRSRPTILIFYRGGWCPYCNVQLQEIQEAEAALRKLGYQIVAISPDRPEILGTTKSRHTLHYQLLSDSDMEASRALGIAFKMPDAMVDLYRTNGIDLEESSGRSHHLLPVPSAFVIGTNGIVAFAYVNPNYQTRVSGDVLLAAARVAISDK